MSECVGIHIVGYTMMMYGLGNTLGSFSSGKLLMMKMKVQTVLVVLALHLSVMVFLIIWKREPILLLIMFVTLLWGICDGTWTTVYSSKCRCMFKVQVQLPAIVMPCNTSPINLSLCTNYLCLHS